MIVLKVAIPTQNITLIIILLKNYFRFAFIFLSIKAPNWRPLWTKFRPKIKDKKVRLKSISPKTFEKCTFLRSQTDPLKIENIVKPFEGCSKSHFSHSRNEVEKVTPRHLFLERFLEPKSTQDRKKRTRNRYKNHFDF